MYRSRGSSVTGSPLTTANGISPCAGSSAVGAMASGSLDATISSLGFIGSLRAQMHCAAHVIERLARRFARLLRALGGDTAQQLGVVFELLRALAHAVDLLDDLVDQRHLTVQAPDARGAASLVHPLLRGFVRIDLVQVPYGTLLRITGVRAPHPRRV